MAKMKAIVIGATSGLGRGIAERLATQGWQVGIAGRRLKRLDQIASAHGEAITTSVIDGTREDATSGLDSIIERMGFPDLVVYASGIGWQNPELKVEMELDMVRTNCEGMIRIVDHMFNRMRSYVRSGEASPNRRLHIAVITSVAGTNGIGTAPAYSATKRMQSTYITALAQLARMEHLPIDFTDIRPGFVATEILNPERHYPMVMSVNRAVDHIMRGLKRRRRIVTFDYRFRLIVALWRLIPRAIWERLTFIRN